MARCVIELAILAGEIGRDLTGRSGGREGSNREIGRSGGSWFLTGRSGDPEDLGFKQGDREIGRILVFNREIGRSEGSWF
jgi:hypothetical protein